MDRKTKNEILSMNEAGFLDNFRLKCTKCNEGMTISYFGAMVHRFPCQAFCMKCGMWITITHGGEKK